jgi:hypothetical protein
MSCCLLHIDTAAVRVYWIYQLLDAATRPGPSEEVDKTAGLFKARQSSKVRV